MSTSETSDGGSPYLLRQRSETPESDNPYQGVPDIFNTPQPSPKTPKISSKESPKIGTYKIPKAIPASSIRRVPRNPDARRTSTPKATPTARPTPKKAARIRKEPPFGDRGENDPKNDERYKLRSRFKTVGSIQVPSALRSRGYAIIPRTEEELEEVEANRVRYNSKHFGRGGRFGAKSTKAKKASK